MSVIAEYVGGKRKEFWAYMKSWQSTAYSLAVLAATVVVIFWASFFLYTSFYFTFMPQESVTWPIHFNYRSCVEEPGLCSNPTSVVGVTDPTRGSVLVRGQRYRVVVDLEMPESPTNQKIGMFLVSMEMRSQDGDQLRRSSRSAMLRYKSPLLHTISTFVFAPFLLYGLQQEKQTVTVELFSQYEEDPVTPLWEVGVEVNSWHVELYSATLRVHATFSGLRYVMYYYPLFAAALGVGICMVFLSSVVILSWYQFSRPTLMVQSQMRSPPSGQSPGLGASPAQTSTLATILDSTKKPGDSGATPGTPSMVPGKLQGDGTEARHSDDEGASSGGSRGGERSKGDDFEVVGTSKLIRGAVIVGQRQGEVVEAKEEREHVVRHRVQSVVE